MIKNKLCAENTVFYSTANAGYAIYAATSLLTIRDHIPDAKLSLLSSGLSKYDKKILKKNRIDFHEIDLSDKFTKTWDYPIDCYYIFAGPELFHREGYDYSVYVDGDVLCARNPLEGVTAVEGIAGVPSLAVNGRNEMIFGGDWSEIRNIWELQDKVAERSRINAGVVYFNNTEMDKLCFLSKATKLYAVSLSRNIPRKGDDSLFSLLQYVHASKIKVKFLRPAYNYVLQFNEWKYPIDGLVFFHFSLDKPWKKRPYSHDNKGLDMFNPLVRTWRRKLRLAAFRYWLANTLRL